MYELSPIAKVGTHVIHGWIICAYAHVRDAHAIINLAIMSGAVGAVQDMGELDASQLCTIHSYTPNEEKMHHTALLLHYSWTYEL